MAMQGQRLLQPWGSQTWTAHPFYWPPVGLQPKYGRFVLCYCRVVEVKRTRLGPWFYRAPVSMGAVSALAPTVFESVSASIHRF